MEELLKEALAPGVSLRDFFLNYVPKIHEIERAQFSKMSKVPLILSFYFEDVDERYTIELSPQGARVEDDELVDFPLITLLGHGRYWEASKPALLELGLTMASNREALQAQVKRPLERSLIEEFVRKFQGVIELKVSGVAGIPGALELSVVLNDYMPTSGSPSFCVSLDEPSVRALASGRVRAKELGDAIKVTGQVKLAMNLAGFMTTHFDV